MTQIHNVYTTESKYFVFFFIGYNNNTYRNVFIYGFILIYSLRWMYGCEKYRLYKIVMLKKKKKMFDESGKYEEVG